MLAILSSALSFAFLRRFDSNHLPPHSLYELYGLYGAPFHLLSSTPPSFNTLALSSSMAYARLYTTSFTPDWTILTAQGRQGQLKRSEGVRGREPSREEREGRMDEEGRTR